LASEATCFGDGWSRVAMEMWEEEEDEEQEEQEGGEEGGGGGGGPRFYHPVKLLFWNRARVA